MTKKTASPAHEVVYKQLRKQILFGDLVPGQAVTIQGLTESLGAGMTPVREALRRLISEGALAFQGNRRVSVPVLTPENVNELIFARQAIEPQLIILATQKAKPADLDAIEAIDAKLDQAIEAGDVHGYLKWNYAFHKGLYKLADAPILSGLSNSLWLRFGPSLRIVCGRIGTSNMADKHRACIAAMRAGDAQAAARAIREDVVEGMEHVKRHLSEQ